jgi:mannose-6-phosphate isomerase-like protein (cupin superfamily)
MRALTLLVAALAALPPAAAAQTDDSRVRVIGRDRVEAAFAKGEPLVEVTDYKIHASRREGPGMSEIHTRDTDVIYVLRGSAAFVTGGSATGAKTTGPEEIRGAGIEGGETRQIRAGDVVVIPNGTPHWFKEVRGPLLYYVVKVRQAPRADGARAAR